jgi:hypothetical protein
VDLVEDDVAQAVEGGGRRVDHVAEDLGGHHHDRCVAVDGIVPGQQADLLGPVPAGEVAELLIRKGLQWGGVEGLAPLGQGLRYRILGHDRLARARGGGDEDGAAGVEGVEGLDLEVVEAEGVGGRELVAGHFFSSRPMRMAPS